MITAERFSWAHGNLNAKRPHPRPGNFQIIAVGKSGPNTENGPFLLDAKNDELMGLVGGRAQ